MTPSPPRARGNHGPNVLVSGVCLGQPAGGVRRHNAEILPRVARLLEANGGRLAVLEGRVPITFDLPDSVERIPSRVHWLPAPMRAVRETTALAGAIANARVQGRPFDLVHTAHQPTPRALPLPFTLTIHDLRSLDLDRAPFVRRLMGGKVLHRATLQAARIFTVSPWMARRIEETFPHAAGKVDVIGNGIDHLPLLPRAPLTEDPFVVHVGHLEPRKNLDLLIRALHRNEALPRLILAGSPKGDAGTTLSALAESLGVTARVEFRDDPSDGEVARLYAEAACAVFPSRLEGHGIGPLEALRAGCPVACSEIPAHRESVGESAAFFGVDDPAGCAAKILESLSSQAAVRDAGPTGSLWDQCAERLWEGWTRACP